MKLYNISKPLIYEGSLTKHDPTFKSVMDLLHLAPVLGLAVPDALPFFSDWLIEYIQLFLSKQIHILSHKS
jgi:hypothetical protein